MRIRYKKWARPELEASAFYIDNPEEMKGKWKEKFKKQPSIFKQQLFGCASKSFNHFYQDIATLPPTEGHAYHSRVMHARRPKYTHTMVEGRCLLRHYKLIICTFYIFCVPLFFITICSF